MPLAEIKDFNPLIDKKPFFDQSVENKQEVYKKHFEISRNDNSITGNLLDYLSHQNYYKLIGIDLSRQIQIFLNKLILQENWKKIMCNNVLYC